MALRFFTVHVAATAPAPVLVKEGFSWPAFLFTGFWALWKRMWLGAAILFAVTFGAALVAAALGVGAEARPAVSLGVGALVGYSANDLLRWTLARRGYAEVAVVGGAREDDALRRYLDHEGSGPGEGAA